MRALQVEVDLGKFDSADEAARAHDRAAVWCLGLTATTNFPVADTLRVRACPGPLAWRSSSALLSCGRALHRTQGLSAPTNEGSNEVFTSTWLPGTLT